jgi:hypothetical protein
MLTTHIPLMPSLRTSGARPPPSHMPSWRIQGQLYFTSNNKKEGYTAYVSRVARLKPHSYIAPCTSYSIWLYYRDAHLLLVLRLTTKAAPSQPPLICLHGAHRDKFAFTFTYFKGVGALRYKSEDRGFDSRWGQWDFSLN